MIDDLDDVLSGYDSPVDAFRAAQAHIRKIDRAAQANIRKIDKDAEQ
jgi:hypothetical protein